MISVTIQSSTIDLGADWDDLVSRASPNVFMSPAALRAVEVTAFSKLQVLLAWDDRVQPRRLVGLWAMQKRRTWPLWIAVLEALPYEYAFLSSPVIDLDAASDVMPAFLKAIAGTPTSPNVILMKSLDAEAISYPSMIDALATQGGRVMTIKTENRPMISRDSTEKMSGERRKKLRQAWKRMSAVGDTAIVFASEPNEVAAVVETFLQLEFKSWKGAAGTALLCRDEDAAFVRKLIANLAEKGQVRVEELKIDGQTIAVQILLFCGTMAYTWKTAFDPAYGKFSPGVIMIDKLTDCLFANTSISGIDSCSVESSFMAQIWSGRRAMADVLVAVGPGPSIAFWVEAAWQVGREQLKSLYKRFNALREQRRQTAPTRAPAVIRPATAPVAAPQKLRHVKNVSLVPDSADLVDITSSSKVTDDTHPAVRHSHAANTAGARSDS